MPVDFRFLASPFLLVPPASPADLHSPCTLPSGGHHMHWGLSKQGLPDGHSQRLLTLPRHAPTLHTWIAVQTRDRAIASTQHGERLRP